MLKKLLVLITIIFFSSNLYGQQRNCATYESNQILKKRFPNRKDITDQRSLFQTKVERYKQQRKESRLQEDTIIIPVIFHIVHNGDSIGTNENISAQQVQSQLDVLNEDFQKRPGTLGDNSNPVGTGMPIKFLPAVLDPNGHLLAEPGIHRVNGNRPTWDDLIQIDTILKKGTVFDPTRYLNIWVVTFGGVLYNKLGYGQLPEMSSLSGIDIQNNPADYDGLVIRCNALGRVGNLVPKYDLGRTVTHEMGHFLGLLHIWGNADDNLNCVNDDGCEDTPKTTGPITGCPSVVASCDSGVNAFIDDYMDYANDACMHLFTNDQRDRMNVVLANCPRRKELTSSLVYLASVPVAKFGLSDTAGCYPKQIGFYDSSAAYTYINSWTWTITNTSNTTTSPIVSHSKNLLINFIASGKYKVSLEVGNITGNKDTLVKERAFEIYGKPALSLQVFFPNNTVTNCKMANFSISGASDYIWLNSTNADTVKGASFSIMPQKNFTLSVIGTSIYGCKNEIAYSLVVKTTTCEVVTVPGTISGITNSDAEIRVFPNPFDEILNIETGNTDSNPLEITVFNIQGIEIKRVIAEKSSAKSFTISTADLPKGFYWIKVNSGDSQLVVKMIRQ